jgi:dihydrofolate reductase
MGVIVSSLTSADGIRDEPMAWIGDLFDADAVSGSIQQLKSADAFLMGRGSYQAFAPFWSGGGDPYTDALAAMPKYVFSATLERTDWANTTIVRTDAVEAVRALPGTSLMYGFGRLARSLLAAGLVDELHFGVHPVTVEPARTPLTLLGVDRLANGAVALRYAPGVTG